MAHSPKKIWVGALSALLALFAALVVAVPAQAASSTAFNLAYPLDINFESTVESSTIQTTSVAGIFEDGNVGLTTLNALSIATGEELADVILDPTEIATNWGEDVSEQIGQWTVVGHATSVPAIMTSETGGIVSLDMSNASFTITVPSTAVPTTNDGLMAALSMLSGESVEAITESGCSFTIDLGNLDFGAEGALTDANDLGSTLTGAGCVVVSGNGIIDGLTVTADDEATNASVESLVAVESGSTVSLGEDVSLNSMGLGTDNPDALFIGGNATVVLGGSVEGPILNNGAFKVANTGSISEIPSGTGSIVYAPGSTTPPGTQASNIVQIVFENSGMTPINIPGDTTADAIVRAQKYLQLNGLVGTIYYTTGPTTNLNDMPVGYADTPSRPTSVTMGFQGNTDAALGADSALNAAINEAMGTNGVMYIGEDSPNNIMWAVVEGTPNTFASVSFTYPNALGTPQVVFSNSNLPEAKQLDNAPLNLEGAQKAGYANSYVNITNSGKGLVWFAMTTGAGASGANSSVTTLSSSYVPSGTSYSASAPICADYTATAWSSGFATTQGTTSSQPVGVNGVSYYYTDPNTGKPMPFNNTVEGYPTLVNQYAQAGDDIVLSAGAQTPQGAVSGWAYGTTYGIGTSFTMPEPAGYNPIQMIAVFGRIAYLNLKPSESGVSLHFPTGDGGMFVDADGENWPIPLTEEGLPQEYTLAVGTDANNVLPTLPGVINWLGNPYKTVAPEFANKAAAFVGWYSWDNVNGYTLYEAGDTVPQYGTLQLYPLFAPVDVDWEVASVDGPTTPYDFTGYNAPGQVTTYTFSASADTEALPGMLNVDAIDTSAAAADLLNKLVSNAINAVPDDPDDAAPNSVSGLEFVTCDDTVSGQSFELLPTWTPVNGVKIAYTGTENGPYTFTVYVPAGFKTYDSDINIDVTSIPGLLTQEGVPANSTLFVKVANVLVSVTPAGSGAVSVAPNTSDSDEMMDITAVPAEGYVFDHWSISEGQFPAGIDETATTITVPNGSGTWVANFVATNTSGSSVVVYRLYNPYTHEHLYTQDLAEQQGLVSAGWDAEGIAWVSPKTSDTPVYRLYNPFNSDHYYCTSRAEANGLVDLGWVYDFDGGAAFYSAPQTGVPIYQLFNPYETANTHLWTGDYNEYVTNQARGWEGEGTSWYALSLG